jgi:hypothetical protein
VTPMGRRFISRPRRFATCGWTGRSAPTGGDQQCCIST